MLVYVLALGRVVLYHPHLLLLYICPMFVAASHRRGTSHCL